MKTLKFIGTSRSDLEAFPVDARREAGYQLFRIQSGFEPSDWKPMTSLGAGVYEIRIHAGGEFRIFYVAKREDAVYVLHAFQKKTQKTRQSDLDLAKQRLKVLGG